MVFFIALSASSFASVASLSLWQGVATTGKEEDIYGLHLGVWSENQVVYGLDINLFRGTSSEEADLQFDLYNKVTNQDSGIQAGVVNQTGRGVYGLQVGCANLIHIEKLNDFDRARSEGDFLYGVQAGVFNFSVGETHGLQVGAINFTKGDI